MSTPLPEHITRPEFAVAVRGYDRSQVDDYVGRMLGWLAEAEARVAAAHEASQELTREVAGLRSTVSTLEERSGVPAPQSLNVFGERLGQVMQSAMDAAEELRAEAEREAHERRTAADTERERLLEEARAEAEELLARAGAKERSLDESIHRLIEKREAALADLARIQAQLAAVLSDARVRDPSSLAAGAPRPAGSPQPADADTVGADVLAGTAASPTGQPSVTAGLPATPTATAVMPVTIGAAVAGAEGVAGERPGAPAASTPSPTLVQPATGGAGQSGTEPDGPSARPA